jgi:hypothetical protein
MFMLTERPANQLNGQDNDQSNDQSNGQSEKLA